MKYWERTRGGESANSDSYRGSLRKVHVQVVEWARALSLTLVAPVRIPAVCQSRIGVVYIQLTISNNCATGIGLAYSLRSSIRSIKTMEPKTEYVLECNMTMNLLRNFNLQWYDWLLKSIVGCSSFPPFIIRPITWNQCEWHNSHILLRTFPSYIDIPMVHTQDREPVAQVARRWLDLQEVLGSNSTGVHSFAWLPKSCWWDRMKVVTSLITPI